MRYLSLFSGMEAAHLAWGPLGWECVGVAEIDPSACALLAHRLPHVPNLGSVTDITAEAIAALGRIDVVIGGSPCQDLSVAGKRAGLAGARSGLFHEQLRIFHAARSLCGARWLVWENVPGAFSSNAGRDFAVVVGDMAGLELAVPEDGWGNEGVALGANGLVEWSVLDAQWFGVAQRRRRVFAVLDTGNWTDRPPVLLEPESLRGDSAPRRETGEGIAERAKDGPGDGRWPALVAPTLNCAFGDKQGLEDQHALSGAGLFVPDYINAITAHNGQRNEVSDILNGCVVEAAVGVDAYNGALTGSVAATLGTRGSSQNATGPQVAVALFDERNVTSPTNRAACRSDGAVPTMHEKPFAIAFDSRQECVSNEHVAGSLGASSPQAQAVASTMAVRRLTPRECERLQGAEDDWTLVPNAKGKPMADGPRYKMLGNSFAVPVIRWIGRQIERAVQQSRMRAAA